MFQVFDMLTKSSVAHLAAWVLLVVFQHKRSWAGTFGVLQMEFLVPLSLAVSQEVWNKSAMMGYRTAFGVYKLC